MKKVVSEFSHQGKTCRLVLVEGRESRSYYECPVCDKKFPMYYKSETGKSKPLTRIFAYNNYLRHMDTHSVPAAVAEGEDVIVFSRGSLKEELLPILLEATPHVETTATESAEDIEVKRTVGLFGCHVPQVAEFAKAIYRRFGADPSVLNTEHGKVDFSKVGFCFVPLTCENSHCYPLGRVCVAKGAHYSALCPDVSEGNNMDTSTSASRPATKEEITEFLNGLSVLRLMKLKEYIKP